MIVRNLTRWTLTAALFLTVSAVAYAGPDATQAEAEKEHRGQGYAFFAPGGLFTRWGHTGTAHCGAGGEGLLYRGIGIGAEAGYLTPWRDFSAGIGMVSADGSYHFMRNRKVSPFVTGGYTLAFRDGAANMVNVGGGANWWVKEGLGLRLEFRDHIYSESYGNHTERIHYLGGRIGFAFR
jgi:hypothetical protein